MALSKLKVCRASFTPQTNNSSCSRSALGVARLLADRALEQHVVAELMRALQLDAQGSGLPALSVVRLSGRTHRLLAYASPSLTRRVCAPAPGNHLGDAGAQALCAACPAALQPCELHLTRRGFTAMLPHLAHLAHSMVAVVSQATTLVTLGPWRCLQLWRRGHRCKSWILAVRVKHVPCQFLCHLTTRDACTLACVAGNIIGDAGAIQLASAMLALSQLHTLDLSRTMQFTLAALSAAVAPHASRLCCCTQATRLEPRAVLPLLLLLHPVSSCKV